MGILEGSFEFSKEALPERKKFTFRALTNFPDPPFPPFFSNVAAEVAKTVCPQRIWLNGEDDRYDDIYFAANLAGWIFS